MKKDIDLIQESINYIFDKKLSFLFKDISIFNGLAIVGIDKNDLHVFHYNDSKIEYGNIKHSEIILDDTLKGWGTYLRQKEDLEKYLHGSYQKNKIASGGIFTEFKRVQALRKRSIYTTEVSYICTIIHELGHIYFNITNPWYFNNRGYTLEVLDRLGGNENSLDLSNFEIRMPADYKGYQSELFAFCTEYSFAKKYFQEHATNIDKEILRCSKIDREEEAKKDLLKEDSIFNDMHMFAMYMGKILIEKYGDKWSKVLLKKNIL